MLHTIGSMNGAGKITVWRQVAQRVISTGARSEAWIKLGRRANLSSNKDASPEWYAIPQERAVAEAIEGARKAGNLHYLAGDSMWPTVRDQYHKSISAYVNGDIDLDTALKQIDAAWPAQK